MLVDNWEAFGLQGNDKFEGFCKDLLHELSIILGFHYEMVLVEDGAHGVKGKEGEWNGLIAEVVEGRADIAVADLTITRERESAVDFTMPFMSLGVGILFQKPKKVNVFTLEFLAHAGKSRVQSPAVPMYKMGNFKWYIHIHVHVRQTVVEKTSTYRK